ncbi:histone H1-like [Cebidichthys violaceus]|uniref:histone H1-like n=1 Tax=Cebidichthys violaceus TaxID=271503 RepID=UPI0035CC3FA9
MAEVAPAPAAAPAKAAKKKVSRPKKTGPSVAELIVETVAASKERNGVSIYAVKKALTAGGYDVEKTRPRVKTVIQRLVTMGTLVVTKGTGASGFFKISKKAGEERAAKRTKSSERAKKAASKAKKAASKAKKAASKARKAARKARKAAAKKALTMKAAAKKAAAKKAAASGVKL